MDKRSICISRYRGSGLLSSLGGIASTVVNKTIDLLPVEAHLPGYSYCGPGTRLEERLRRGDPGKNKLDEACKAHDIAYSKYGDSENRRIADKTLAEKAWERVKASDSGLGEKAASWFVTNVMKAKTKLGGGKNKKVKTSKKKKSTKKQNTGKAKKCPCKKHGRGLYLKPFTGRGVCSKKKSTRSTKQFTGKAINK